MTLRIDRWVLDPARVIPVLFATQLVVWYFGMPELPSIPGTAPRFHGAVAPLRYLAIFALLAGGVFFGRWLPRLLLPVDSAAPQTEIDALRALRPLAWVALALTIVGEVIYTRAVLADPQSIVRAFYLGAFATVAEDVSGARVVGASSLNNLFVIPTAVFALLAFHPATTGDERRRARRVLTGLGIAVLAHALILSARMYVLYFVMVSLAAYLIVWGKRVNIRVRTIVLCAGAFMSVVWAGEMLRGGLAYAVTNQTSVFSPDAQRYVRSRLVEAYIASDLNNALVLLECPPALQLAGTTALRGLVPAPLAYEDRCQSWQSSYATVNTMALWWFDNGWFALVVAFAVGCWLGILYAQVRGGRLGIGTLLFLVSYPGLYAMTRVNFFGLTVFLLPAGFLVAVVAWREARRLIGTRDERRPLPSPLA